LAAWINKERFPKFVKVTRARFGHLLNTKKLLVMAVLEENKIGHISPEMEEFRAMLMQVTGHKFRQFFVLKKCYNLQIMYFATEFHTLIIKINFKH
jgi:hypothetical protein